MPIPKDFLQDASGDLSFARGLEPTPDLVTFTAQALRKNLAFFAGEWFLDLRLGIPYWRSIIGQRPDFGLLESVYRRGAGMTRGVGSVTRCDVTFDNRARRLAVDMGVLTVQGEPVPLPGPFVIEVPG